MRDRFLCPSVDRLVFLIQLLSLQFDHFAQLGDLQTEFVGQRKQIAAMPKANPAVQQSDLQLDLIHGIPAVLPRLQRVIGLAVVTKHFEILGLLVEAQVVRNLKSGSEFHSMSISGRLSSMVEVHSRENCFGGHRKLLLSDTAFCLDLIVAA